MDRELPDVFRIPGIGYGVASLSTPGAFRLVSGKDCTCPAGGARSCRHRKMVAAFCAAEAEKHKRPVASPHIAALVD